MSPVVVAILYPSYWYGSPEDFAAEVATIEAIDPQIEVLVREYDEGQASRTLRGAPPYDEARSALAPLTPEQLEVFGRMEIALGIDLPFDVAAAAPNLRWVQGVGAGSAQLQSAGLGPAGIRLTNASGANAVGIAEFAVGRMISEWKHFRDIDHRQQAHKWDPVYGSELAGSTLGLLGMGAIASAVASRARAFDMEILATRRNWQPGATAPNVAELFPADRLHEMLSHCDAVIAAVPETPETIGLIDAAAFEAMRPGAWFCNVGRGTLVDEPALIAALESGHLRGAALDVASREPLPADDPLWDAPNLQLSFHCSAAPGKLFTNLHQIFAENLRRYLAGEALMNEVEMLSES
jgi:phosphoglycerate dehydrogenase-like enzyme